MLCDKCIFNLFWEKLNRSKDHGIKDRLANLSQYQAELDQLETDLNNRGLTEEREQELEQGEHNLDEREDLLTAKEAEIEARIRIFEAGKVSLINKHQEQINQVRTEIEALKKRQDQALHQAESRGYQKAVDDHEYQDYSDAVARNQLRRG
jgi:hypothetical protein